MKRKKTIWWISTFGILLAMMGCTQSDSSLTNKGIEKFGTEVRVGINVIPPASRATNLTTDNIDHFGLMINVASPNSWKEESHVSRIKVENVWQPWNITPQQSWLNETNTVEVLAYAPYQTVSPITINGTTRILTLNATTQSDKEPIDWLHYYSGKKSLPTLVDNNGVVPIVFVHIMSRLRVEIITREELNGIKPTEVIILGTKPTVEWSSATPSSFNVKGTVESIYTTTTGEADNTWSTFIVPQTVTKDNLKIQVTIDGKTYTYTHSAVMAFLKAKAYKISLQLGRDKLELAPDGVTVVDWETGDEISGGNMEEKP